ncbi:MAG: hypothetical protein JKX84_08785 [Flavobacteriales bacterium]|nr:hypothetical protein [Flavobacteriales bacterium]
MKREIPVLLLVYNRPEETVRVLQRLQKCGITQLYISADAPKNVADKVLTDAVSSAILDYAFIIKNKQLSSTNKGCKNGVLSGINWFFNQVDEGIILEDDCLPNSDFFNFCSELLIKYRNENVVKMIGGIIRLGHLNLRKDIFLAELPQFGVGQLGKIVGKISIPSSPNLKIL